MPCLQRKLQLSVALKNINSDARRHKTDQISSRSTEIQDYMRSNVLFVHVLKCVACVHTWGCNSEALEWRGFVVCFCTACATSLRERERDACSSLPAQYTPCWAVHPQLKTYLYCPLELAAHTYMHTAHIHKHIDMHSEPKECASAKKKCDRAQVIFVVLQRSIDFSASRRLILLICSILHSSPLFSLSLKAKCGENYLRQGQELTHTCAHIQILM